MAHRSTKKERKRHTVHLTLIRDRTEIPSSTQHRICTIISCEQSKGPTSKKCKQTTGISQGLSNAPGVVHPRGAAGGSGAGLQHHEAVVHLLQDLLVDGLGDVGQLEGVGGHVVHLHEHLDQKGSKVKV